MDLYLDRIVCRGGVSPILIIRVDIFRAAGTSSGDLFCSASRSNCSLRFRRFLRIRTYFEPDGRSAQCKSMLTAYVTLSLPPVLFFEQYCYFDGFWLRMLSVQFTACTDGSKRCYCKNIHSNTFSRPFRYLHSLDYPLTFYLVISNKKMHPIPCIDRQL